MKKNWVFGAAEFVGNPKWLYLYLQQEHKELNINWIADNAKSYEEIKKLPYKVKVVLRDSKDAQKILSAAEVYVEDQYREYYPTALNKNVIFLNLWHGVGLKNIEKLSPFNGELASRIMKKTIKYFDEYERRTLFLVTSEEMENHFKHNVVTRHDNYLRANYPRVELLGKIKFKAKNIREEKGLDNTTRVIHFCPTYRDYDLDSSLGKLLPDFELLDKTLIKSNSLMIINLHPKMRNDPYYNMVKERYSKSNRFYFIEQSEDIYEYFDQIDLNIIDYSSIFYDLMAANTDKFIRYIPDYPKYVQYHHNMSSYYEKTYGKIIESFTELLDAILLDDESAFYDADKKEELEHFFFSYASDNSVESIVNSVLEFKIPDNPVEEKLISYDIFDTVFKRKTGMPESIFYYVQEKIGSSEITYPAYFVKNYVKIRKQAEADARDFNKKTIFERQTDKLEITFSDIFNRMQEVHDLSAQQVDFLKEIEIDAEISHVSPIRSKIEQLFEQQNEGHKVILISDMYLPFDVIKKMLRVADERLVNIDLYLSSELGYQKTTGLLYQLVFFNIDYKYNSWIHYGDNDFADKKVPVRYGIEVVGHRFWKFNKYEQSFVNRFQSYDGFLVPNIMKELRKTMTFRSMEVQRQNEVYYFYSFVGTYLVPYVSWCVEKALESNIDTMYFISRDGNFLKPIADTIIETRGLKMKTKLIYGSRATWRIPGLVEQVDEEVFSPFGLFQGIDSFEDVLKSSKLTENEFEEFFPTLKDWKDKKVITNQDVILLRKIASFSTPYKKRLLEIASKERKLVCEYLADEVNLAEKFVFVEFWGRGYTQDSLTNMLGYIAKEPIRTEFYYARSIYGNTGESIRTRFTNSPRDLTFIESIFNYVPMKSLKSYSRNEAGQVVPDIIPAPNKYAELFEKYTLQFAKKYAELVPFDEKGLHKVVFDVAVEYFHFNKKDQYILNVFSKFKDNIALNGKPKEYAPIFLARNIIKTPIKDLKKQTKSLEMSLAKSSQNAKRAYKWRQRYERLQRSVSFKKKG